jgi:hypothetical protein
VAQERLDDLWVLAPFEESCCGDRERCKARGVSYVEVQTNDEAVELYFALSYESQPGMRVLSRSYTLSLSAFGFVGAYNS